MTYIYNCDILKLKKEFFKLTGQNGLLFCIVYKELILKGEKTVKKLTSFLLALAVTLSLTACNRQENSDNSSIEGSSVVTSDNPTSSDNQSTVDNGLGLCAPNNVIDYNFDSYEQLLSALTDKNSDGYKDIYTRMEQNTSEEKFELFRKTLQYFETGKIKLCVPQLNGENMKIQSDSAYSQVSFMTSELYRIPWIWYHCGAVSGDEQMIVKLSYLSPLENESIDNAKSYLEVQNIISPSSPNPDNYSNFKNYTSVYEKEITLADNSKATALIFETDNIRETYAEIYKDGILISIRANKEKLTDEFFRSFDVVAMN